MSTRRLLASRRAFLSIAAISLVWTPAPADAEPSAGEEKFNKICLACHTVGGGRRVGPDLKGLHERRTEEWLLKFIPSPQKMITAGDPVAVALQKEYPLVMPDPACSTDDIKEILAYVRVAGGGGVAPAAPKAPERVATAADIRRGQDLFQGHVRLSNGGPTCNSCHHVKNDAVIGGGVLARELTAVFGRMGAPGIHAILGKPPFPVMDEAYRDHALTDDEVFALVSFLQDADKQQAFQQPRDYGFKLVYSGGAGFVVLMGLFGLFGRRRKKLSVNQTIFDRQVKSQ